jgi:hypothetical protein
MIFRDSKGKLIEINRLDFKNDKSYYNKIIQIKNPGLFYDLNLNNILNNNKNTIDKTNTNYSQYLISKIIN